MSHNISLLPAESYLAMIKNSVGSKQFQNLYALVDNQKKDIVEGGNLSCAYYVTSILVIFGLIDKPHSTVNGSVSALLTAGWSRIKEPQPGTVIVWGPDQQSHQHIGFSIGANKAISNSSEKNIPHIHHISYGAKKRHPIGIYWHPMLDNLNKI